MAKKEEFQCPVGSFDPETDDFMTWRKNIQLWYDITDTPKKKIGSTVFFKLKGRARCVVEIITNADLISSAALTNYWESFMQPFYLMNLRESSGL